MSDADRIKKGEALSVFNELKNDRPENIIRRVGSLDTSTADRFASDIGAQRMDELAQLVTTQKITDSLMERPDDEMTTDDWAALKATDY